MLSIFHRRAFAERWMRAFTILLSIWRDPDCSLFSFHRLEEHHKWLPSHTELNRKEDNSQNTIENEFYMKSPQKRDEGASGWAKTNYRADPLQQRLWSMQKWDQKLWKHIFNYFFVGEGKLQRRRRQPQSKCDIFGATRKLNFMKNAFPPYTLVSTSATSPANMYFRIIRSFLISYTNLNIIFCIFKLNNQTNREI